MEVKSCECMPTIKKFFADGVADCGYLMLLKFGAPQPARLYLVEVSCDYWDVFPFPDQIWHRELEDVTL